MTKEQAEKIAEEIVGLIQNVGNRRDLFDVQCEQTRLITQALLDASKPVVVSDEEIEAAAISLYGAPVFHYSINEDMTHLWQKKKEAYKKGYKAALARLERGE